MIFPVETQDITTEEDWVKDTWDHSVLFLANACESEITSKNILGQ